MYLPLRRGEPQRRALLRVLEQLTQANTEWYLREWARVGGPDAPGAPPCCAKCAGTKYWPGPGLVNAHHFHAAPYMFDRGHGHCGEAAATLAGHDRAKAIYKGMDPGVAAHSYFVDVVPDAAVPGGWHAVVQTPEKVKDPSRKMDPWGA